MHNINENRMFCVGECWHDAGKRVDAELTASEAIVSAGQDFEIGITDITALGSIIEGKKATYRKDNKQILGIVTPKYKIVQNIQAFDFFDSIVGEGKAIYHSAGVLGKGEKIWLLAKLPGSIQIAGDDTIEKYLCLINSHDGKSALKMYFTPIRVVCQNTLNASLNNKQESISIRHMGNIKAKVSEAREILKIAEKTYSDIEVKFKSLLKEISSDNVDKYFDNVLQITKEPSTRQKNVKGRLLTLFEAGEKNNLRGIERTVWSAYNSVTEYIDHESTVKNESINPSNRAQSIIIGKGAEIKHRALNLALELV